MRATKQRIAPSGGYGFAAKGDYREFVWKSIGGRSPFAAPLEPVALMPSLEGTEVDVALRAGFRESSLHLIDANPAVVATLRRRFPTANTYGVSVERAHARMAKAGVRLYGASIDLCGTAGYGTASMLGECSRADVWQSGARIVVNVLRGREDAQSRSSMVIGEVLRATEWGRFTADRWDANGVAMRPMDLARAWMLSFSMMAHTSRIVRLRPYVSSNGQSFLTAVIRVVRLRDVNVFLNRGHIFGGREFSADLEDFLRLVNSIGEVTDNDITTGATYPQEFFRLVRSTHDSLVPMFARCRESERVA